MEEIAKKGEIYEFSGLFMLALAHKNRFLSMVSNGWTPSCKQSKILKKKS